MIIKKILFKGILCLSCGYPLAATAQTSSSITSNFNGTSISGDDYLWFNAHLTSITFANEAVIAPEVQINVTNSAVTFSNGGTNYVVNIPDSVLTFSTAAATASGGFFGGEWQVTYPKAGGNNPFLGGVMWDVPAIGLTGGTNPVEWTMDFSSNTSYVSKLSWQWSAAVYTDAPSNPNALNVQFLDGSGKQSGTPLAYTSYVTGGARGGGGSNFTGSNSGTANLTNIVTVPEPSAAILGLVGSILLLRRRRH